MKNTRIVIKVGSALLESNLTPSGLDETLMGHIAQQVGTLYRKGYEIVLVSSGAVMAGMTSQEDYPISRAAMVGQIKLMFAYSHFFEQQGIRAGQALFTHHNFENGNERRVKKNLLDGFKYGEITIVNANDAVTDEEIKQLSCFTENDLLAAKVAILIEADVLLILTDVSGVYRRYGTKDEELIEKVSDIDDDVIELGEGTNSPVGKGGMKTKIKAAELATNKGVMVVIANGGEENAILKSMQNTDPVGTVFLPRDLSKDLRV